MLVTLPNVYGALLLQVVFSELLVFLTIPLFCSFHCTVFVLLISFYFLFFFTVKCSCSPSDFMTLIIFVYNNNNNNRVSILFSLTERRQNFQ